MDRYIARDGDMMDLISFKYYGTEANTGKMLEANPDLASAKAILSAGDIVFLPEFETPPKKLDVIRLWD